MGKTSHTDWKRGLLSGWHLNKGMNEADGRVMKRQEGPLPWLELLLYSIG